jgi:hypothetical protein
MSEERKAPKDVEVLISAYLLPFETNVELRGFFVTAI